MAARRHPRSLIPVGTLSHARDGFLCPDCRELIRAVGPDRGACRICGQVDNREGWAVATVKHHFPGAVEVT